MRELERFGITTPYGNKAIVVLHGDILELDRELDVMTVSAFYRSYYPSPKTMIHALEQRGISTQKLAYRPKLDLRDFCNVWLSHRLANPDLPIRRIGCIEMKRTSAPQSEDEL